MYTIGVIGAGSWGTAIASLLADKKYNVPLWVHNPSLCTSMKKHGENTTFLPGFPLSKNIVPINNLKEVVSSCRTLVLATPSHVLRQVLNEIAPNLHEDTRILCLTKGIEIDTLKLPFQIIQDELPENISQQSCYLSGPTFALEVIKKLPAATVIASFEPSSSEFFQDAFNTPYFRVYTNKDVPGVELGGALKNVIAIAAGVSDGMGNGNNARSALITRALAEIIRLGNALGANPLTFSGLSGLGDLILTCTGDLSRNRSVGIKLGQGKKLSFILSQMEMVAEGVKTTKSAMGLASKLGIEMPVTQMVFEMLYHEKEPGIALAELMSRHPKNEF